MNKTELTIARVREYLDTNPGSTRHDLETALGVQQQRVSEALRALDARIVGYRPPLEIKAGSGNSKPAPEYALPDWQGEDAKQAARDEGIKHLASVWDAPYRITGR